MSLVALDDHDAVDDHDALDPSLAYTQLDASDGCEACLLVAPEASEARCVIDANDSAHGEVSHSAITVPTPMRTTRARLP